MTKHEHLADEACMTADELRTYMTKMEMAKAEKEVSAMDAAGHARQQLVRKLSEPAELTPELLQQVKVTLATKVRKAAEFGETEVLVMRFPVELCADHGRAINNSDETWPDSLTGRPRQAYELWRDHLREAGYKLTAMIIDWPGGLPGDVGFFLGWSAPKA